MGSPTKQIFQRSTAAPRKVPHDSQIGFPMKVHGTLMVNPVEALLEGIT